MKEMQSPRKFNSPLKRRNLFAAKQLPLPIRHGDTIIQGVPIEITCNEYLDGVDTLSGVDPPPTSTKNANNLAPLEHTPGSMDYGGSSFILMNNEED
jgi:hypothetical protein